MVRVGRYNVRRISLFPTKLEIWILYREEPTGPQSRRPCIRRSGISRNNPRYIFCRICASPPFRSAPTRAGITLPAYLPGGHPSSLLTRGSPLPAYLPGDHPFQPTYPANTPSSRLTRGAPFQPTYPGVVPRNRSLGGLTGDVSIPRVSSRLRFPPPGKCAREGEGKGKKKNRERCKHSPGKLPSTISTPG